MRWTKSRRQKAANTKGRMTERVSAVSPRKKPARIRLEIMGLSMDLRRKRKDERRRTKKGFSVPNPRG